MSNYLKAIDIKKSFDVKNGKLDVLGGINLKVEENEFVCIMGNSGCGKSTLIRTLEGVEPIESGNLILNGKEFPSKSSKKIQRNFGVVFQSDNLLEWKTIYENVRLPIVVYGLSKSMNENQKIMEVLKLVGLADFKDCLPRELSGGMRQRAAIARALVSEPEFLMLDQPFGALDAITRKVLNVELLKIWKTQNKTCVMITNSVNEALYLGQRILLLSDSPSKIIKDIKVPFTYEQRREGLELNPEYLELRAKLNQLVRSLN